MNKIAANNFPHFAQSRVAKSSQSAASTLLRSEAPRQPRNLATQLRKTHKPARRNAPRLAGAEDGGRVAGCQPDQKDRPVGRLRGKSQS